MAVAGALVFGRFVSGELEVPESVSVGVAEGIKALLDPYVLQVVPVHYDQRPYAFGEGCFTVNGAVSENWPAAARSNCVTISVLPSDSYSGSVLSSNALSIAANAFLHDSLAQFGGESEYAKLAVGVLFAEDLGVDTLIDEAEGLGPEVRRLLLAAGINVVTPTVIAARG
jgi:hypothetical protein